MAVDFISLGAEEEGTLGGFDGDFDLITATKEENTDEIKTEDVKPVVVEEESKKEPTTAELMGLIAKNSEDTNRRLEAIATTTLAAVAPKVEPEKEPELIKPEFTAAEWEERPEECADALVDFKMAVKDRSASDAAKAQNAKDQEEFNSLKQTHDEGWDAIVSVIPELDGENSSKELRDIFGEHFTPLNTDPMGTVKAMKAFNADPRAIAKLAELRAPAADQAQDETTIIEDKPAKVDVGKAAADEATRSVRVVTGAMMGGGKGGGAGAVTLSKSQRDVCKSFGISGETYAKSLKACKGDA